jgi:hypothetical protein
MTAIILRVVPMTICFVCGIDQQAVMLVLQWTFSISTWQLLKWVKVCAVLSQIDVEFELEANHESGVATMFNM